MWFPPFPKKEVAVEYKKHQTIHIMSQLGTVILTIIRNSIRQNTDNKVAEEQKVKEQ